MKTLLTILELFSGAGLIVAILLHSPKGEGIGAIGAQARVFQSPQKDLERGLDRVTYVLVIVFLAVATILGLFY